MSQINAYYTQAQLALAAYGTFQNGLPPNRNALINTGMGLTQADNFAADWRVVQQYDESHSIHIVDPRSGLILGQGVGSNGLSVTLFGKTDANGILTGEQAIAIRGTEFTVADLLTDAIDIGILGTAKYQSQYTSLTSKINEWLQNGVLSSTFTVTGHSLGGFLAAGIAIDFPLQAQQAFLFNAPGITGVVGSVVAAVWNVLHPGQSISITSNLPITNLRADAGLSPISNLGIPIVDPTYIHIENQNSSTVNPKASVRNHSQGTLTEALAVYDLFSRASSGIGVDDVSAILKASSKSEGGTLEGAVNALSKLFGVSSPPLQDNVSRDDLYLAIGGLQNALPPLGTTSPYVLATLSGVSSESLKNLAMSVDDNGTAYRYALKALNPFVAFGPTSLYQPHNVDGALGLYVSPTSNPSGMTAAYLADRAAMLAFLITGNTNDVNAFASNQVSDQVLYRDSTKRADGKGTDLLVFLPGGTPNFGGVNTRVNAFGTDGADWLQGRDNIDHLYGGLGSDILTGGTGNDYLEGGVGKDVYIYSASSSSNDGADTIFDADGKGLLRYNYSSSGVTKATIVSDASVKISNTQWQSADGKFTYERALNSTDLTVTFAGVVGGSIKLLNFKNGDFGIQLQGEPLNANIEFIDNEDNDYVTLGYATNGTDPGQYYITDGNGAVSNFTTLPESATFVLQGGGGRDMIQSAIGGNGIDTEYDSWNEELYAGQKSDLSNLAGQVAVTTGGDLLSGLAGDDQLVGSAGNDLLFGGNDADVLFGGEGDDVMLGDDSVSFSNSNGPNADWEIREKSGGDPFTREFRVSEGVYVELYPSHRAGNDVLVGGGGKDWMAGQAGDDVLMDEDGDDILSGGSGDDALFGGAGNDLIEGDSETTRPYVSPGGFYIVTTGRDENNALVETVQDITTSFDSIEVAGRDYLDGGAGNDTLWGRGGDDTLVGGTGNDLLVGGSGKDTYIFARGDGVDTIDDTLSNANDAEASVILLGDGYGVGFDRSQIKYRTGSLLIDLGGGDAIHLAGWDRLNPLASSPIDRIEFSDGSAITYADILAQGFDIDGTAGDDDGHDAEHPILEGTGVTDRISGFAGNDILKGFDGDDTLNGGTGNDLLIGGAGTNVYAFAAGDGHDIIQNTGDTYRIQLTGIAAADVHFSIARDKQSLLIQYTANDTVTIEDHNFGDGGEIAFDNGTIVQVLSLIPGLLAQGFDIDGTEEDDDNHDVAHPKLLGTSIADRIRGFGGNDIIEGLSSDDILDGGSGDDSLAAGSGRDQLHGGTGNDTLDGGTGNDVYTFAVGDGNDTIEDAGGIDRIRMSGVTAADLTFEVSTDGQSLVIHYGTDDSITFAGHRFGVIEQISFNGGPVMSLTSLIPASAYASGTVSSGGQVVVGLSDLTAITGGAIESLAIGGGNTTYVYNLGNGRQTIVDLGGTDTIEFGAGITVADVSFALSDRADNGPKFDVLVNGVAAFSIVDGEYGVIENYRFASGAVLTHADLLRRNDGFVPPPPMTAPQVLDHDTGFVTLGGRGGDDIGSPGSSSSEVMYIPGPGDDFVQVAGDVAYRYLFNLGDGHDTLNVGITHDRLGQGRDTVSQTVFFGGGITEDSIFVGVRTHEYNVGGPFGSGVYTGQDLNISYGDQGDSLTILDGYGNARITQYVFADGRTYDTEGLVALGVQGHVAVPPGEGRGSGPSSLNTGPRTIYGTNADDIMGGTQRADILFGGAGNDILSGGAGNDTYIFNIGDGVDTINDVALAGEGNRVLFATGIAPGDIRLGLGSLVLYIGTGGDAIHLSNFDEWNVLGLRTVETFEFADGTVLSYDQLLHRGIERGDGSVMPYEELIARQPRIRGTAGDDYIEGTAYAERISGLTGDDYLAGGGGDDVYEFAPGDGVDTIDDIPTSGAGNRIRFGDGILRDDVHLGGDFPLITVGTDGDGIDLANFDLADWAGTSSVQSLEFADGQVLSFEQFLAEELAQEGTPEDDYLEGTTFGEQLSGLAGDDYLTGLDGNDTLYGGGGDDNLRGDAGNDLLNGGEGNDSLQGGEGDDTYSFGASFGADYLSDEGGNDTIQLGAGIAPADVLVTSDPYSTLYLVRAGSADRIELPDWYTDDAYKIEQVSFSDGTIWSAADLESRVTHLQPTQYGDVLIDTAGDDTIAALDGDDRIYAGEGNDSLSGDAGGDYLLDLAGYNILDGDDTLETDGGAGLTLGGDGDDTLYLAGTSDPDGAALMIGGAGSDNSVIYSGSAIVAFNAGDGQDSIGVDNTTVSSWALSLGGGIVIDDITVSLESVELVFGFGSGDVIRIYVGPDEPELPATVLQVIGADIRTYDLNAVIGAFYTALAEDPELAHWSATQALEDNLVATSTTEAIGGTIAWQYATSGSVEGMTTAQIRSVLAGTGFGSAPQAIDIGTLVNHTPVVSATDHVLTFDQTVDASALFSVTDADGDTLTQYEFWDSTAGGGHFAIDDVEQGVNVTIAVSATDLANTQFASASTTSTDQVWVRANDGHAWSDWKSWTVSSWPHATNSAPVASASDTQVLVGESAQAADLFSISDMDGDTVTQYQFWDDVAAGGYFAKDGVAQNSNPIDVSAEDLANLQYVAGATPGTEGVWVRASDGMQWGDWKHWNITSALHPSDAAPEAQATATQTVTLNQAVDAASLFSVSDADGDPVVQYQFYDSTIGNGHFAVHGVTQAENASIDVTAADLAYAQFVGAYAPGSDQVWVRASDGQIWGDWKSWTMNSWTHLTNSAPVAVATDTQVLVGESAQVTDLFTVTDADGDSVVQYQFWDDVAGGGYFALDGVAQNNNPIEVAATDLAVLEYVAGTTPGTEGVWVRASDGMQWGGWKHWSITSALHLDDAAPEVQAAATQTVTLDQAVNASSFFSVSDADGDPVLNYQFYDSTTGKGHFTVNGVAQAANASIDVSAANLVSTEFVGASAAGSDLLWVRASDGQVWGDWKSWTVNSWPHATNSAPVVSASDATVTVNQAVSAASLFSVWDAEGDAVASYEFWDEVNGGGRFTINGVQQASGQSIAVAAGRPGRHAVRRRFRGRDRTPLGACHRRHAVRRVEVVEHDDRIACAECNPCCQRHCHPNGAPRSGGGCVLALFGLGRGQRHDHAVRVLGFDFRRRAFRGRRRRERRERLDSGFRSGSRRHALRRCFRSGLGPGLGQGERRPGVERLEELERQQLAARHQRGANGNGPELRPPAQRSGGRRFALQRNGRRRRRGREIRVLGRGERRRAFRSEWRPAGRGPRDPGHRSRPCHHPIRRRRECGHRDGLGARQRWHAVGRLEELAHVDRRRPRARGRGARHAEWRCRHPDPRRRRRERHPERG
jgi:Ca2+-binding RTX toxin-like protein